MTPPATDEVQIKVVYCGVCGTDVHIDHGAGVTGYKIGDKVVVRPLDDREEHPSDKGFSHICKKLKFIGIDSPGAMQQYWNVPAFTLHKIPDHTDMKLAALLEPLSVACHDVRMAELQKGELAVVLGGGPIGMLVAMVSKKAGARVIISEINPVRLSLAKELGFEVVNPQEINVVDYI